ncbi:MAG: hypothetical protein ABIK28_04500 [Planctomycetota bacterium]
MKNAVMVFAKVPIHGSPKSRIAREAGRDRRAGFPRTGSKNCWMIRKKDLFYRWIFRGMKPL